MIATIALIAALALVVIGVWRFGPSAPRALGPVSLAATVVAGALGATVWYVGGDSRWLVAGLLLFLAAPVTIFAVASRGLKIAALVLGVLPLALMGIATVSPKAAPPSALNP